jgi:hypothetical protein
MAFKLSSRIRASICSNKPGHKLFSFQPMTDVCHRHNYIVNGQIYELEGFSLRKKKLLSVIIALMFMLTIAAVAVPQAEAAVTLTDINGHWAQTQIQNMVDKGVINGYPDGSFKPENSITRAEFMVMINRANGFTGSGTTQFSDVKSTDWFASEIAKATAAGYINGYPDGSMKPNANISRQEAAVMIAKAAKLDVSTVGDLSKFSDAAGIATWSKAYIAACVKASFINGYPDGTFKAVNNIKRSEAAVIVANTMTVAPAATYSQTGTFGPATGDVTINGNVLISAAGVTLQNTIITGNLTIAESVGDGDVTLKNVTVKGTTYINGGGANSINIDGCELGNVVSNKAGVHISCVNGTTIVTVTLASGATVDVAAGSTIEGVTVSTTGAVTLNGDFASVTVDVPNANVNVASGTVESITIDATATNAAVNIASGATVTSLTTDGAGSEINVESGATLTNLVADAATDVTGTGTITNADVNVVGVSIATTPTHTTVASGITSSIGGNTVNGTGETTTYNPPSTGGGGGSTGSTKTAVSAINVAVLNEKGLVTSGAVAISLASYGDSALISELTITTDPSLAIATATTLTITQIADRNIPFLKDKGNITTTITDGKVTISQILGGLVQDGDVSLGALRTIFSSGDVVITATLSNGNYVFNLGNPMTITITLGAGAQNSVIINDYFTIKKSATEKTATVTISNKAVTDKIEVGDLKASGISFADVIDSFIGGATYADAATDLQVKLGSYTDAAFDALPLSKLIGKTVKFNSYTVSFVGEGD